MSDVIHHGRHHHMGQRNINMKYFLATAILIAVIAVAATLFYMSTSDPHIVDEQPSPIQTTQLTQTPQPLQTPEQQEQDKMDETQKPQSTKTPTWITDTEKPKTQNKDPFKEFWAENNVVEELTGQDLEIDIQNPASLETLRNSLIKRYGDTTEVENYLQTWVKATSSPNNMEYKAEFLRAAYVLSPNPVTRKSLDILNAINNNDEQALQRLSEPAQQNDRFLDVQPFFVNNKDNADAFRQLRHANPKRAAEFEKFLLQQAENNPTMDAEKIKSTIEKSYQTK